MPETLLPEIFLFRTWVGRIDVAFVCRISSYSVCDYL